ncbi:Protein PLANT CADMIUM RESISTANCE 3 [Forsythia ovata]|uniref:Protein PLANT CADMIUM RESISTANCE 3 n=1 Tax=Forsythia ovata TaxID=205694 RepID=A0ABD1W8K0_9LAMI
MAEIKYSNPTDDYCYGFLVVSSSIQHKIRIQNPKYSACVASGALYTLIACITGCAWIYSCSYRTKMRKQFMLPGNPCADCLVHFCCETCALCQEYRELKKRGFDMSIGWHENVKKQNNGITMAPNVQGGMSR